MYQYIVQIIYIRNVCRNLSQIIVIYHKIVTLSESQFIRHSTIVECFCYMVVRASSLADGLPYNENSQGKALAEWIGYKANAPRMSARSDEILSPHTT